MYFLISLLAFSIAPFCHAEYESAKLTTALPSPLTARCLVISMCAENSHPLSVVMVLTCFLYGSNSPTTTLHPSSSLSTRMKFVKCSISVSIAWSYASTIVFISQSPKRLPSASAGRSWMLVQLAMLVALVGRCRLVCLLYFSSCGMCLASFPVLSAYTWL